MHYITETLGTFLALNPYHHYSSIPLVRFEKEAVDTFILCFKREMQLVVIDLDQDSGQSLVFAHASLIERSELLEGIAAVPLEALKTLYVLAFPRDLYGFSEEARLKNIVALYQAHEDVLAFLKATRHIGDQVTAYELEWKTTAKSLADFDPFRLRDVLTLEILIIYRLSLVKTMTSFLIFIPSYIVNAVARSSVSLLTTWTLKLDKGPALSSWAGTCEISN